MFNINEFFGAPLSKEGEEVERVRRVQAYEQELAALKPVTGWKPKHDPSFYDARIPESEVEPEIAEELPEGPLHIRESDTISLPGRTAAERAGRARREDRKALKATREAKKKLKAERKAAREALPPVNPDLTGLELQLDTFLRSMKRTTEWLRGKATITQILEEMHQRPEVSMDGMETYVKRLADLSKTQDTFKMIVPAIGQRLLAVCLGYNTWADMKAASLVNRNNVKNLRLGMPMEIPLTGLVSVHKVEEILRKKKAGVRTLRPLRNDEAEVFRGEMMVGKFAASQMGDLIDDYAAMFRTPWLVGDKDTLKAIAVKRFFKLDSVEALTPYLIAKTFPPGFRPGIIEKKESRLFFHIRSAMLREVKFTALTAFEELKPWCATPEIEEELLRTIGAMSSGKPNRFAQFVRRRYGVVMLTLDHVHGIGLITERDKITTIIPLERKEGKELRRETLSLKPKVESKPAEPVDYDEQQPAFIEPPRVALTSHDPAFKDAFKDLNKRDR
jgi:hypothetical protein